ncbi:hypothetical protein LOTGIDRAFT_169456 [Lottia gigantea]|uniref:EamA domain-containing protein n=1 Tax=Lottia gigantea TaxID=225164 RepID=V3ZLV8_LOTGI|nr:hypothetical protein LOTGIDRAFT_169456 [Lottia gigantea]ESO83385.1 hypothetical protein LOTGIDRAFT_169456 [Lottia gigantea]
MTSVGVQHGTTEELESRIPTIKTTISKRCQCTDTVQKSILGTLLAVITGVLWTSFSQLTQFTDGYQTPFFLTYIITIWLIPFYPVYFVIQHIFCKRNPREVFRENLLLYADNNNIKRVRFLGKTILFSFVWTVCLFTYIKALHLLNGADTTAIHATNQSFVYMLSWIVLFEKFVAIRILALVFSITGIVLFAYVDGFGTLAMWGIVVAVASSASAALYKLLIKKFICLPSLGQISLFLTLIGVIHTISLWPMIILFHFTHVEVIIWSSLPWLWIVASVILFTAHQVLITYAPYISYPLFNGLGLALGIPFSALSDFLWKNKDFSGMKIAALVLIASGLLLILVPESWCNVLLRWIPCGKKKHNRRNGKGNVRYEYSLWKHYRRNGKGNMRYEYSLWKHYRRNEKGNMRYEYSLWKHYRRNEKGNMRYEYSLWKHYRRNEKGNMRYEYSLWKHYRRNEKGNMRSN